MSTKEINSFKRDIEKEIVNVKKTHNTAMVEIILVSI